MARRIGGTGLAIPLELRPIVAEVLRHLVRGNYAALEAAGALPSATEPSYGSRVNAVDCEAEVSSYPATLLEPPAAAYESGRSYAGKFDDGSGWYVRMHFWSEEEQESDLAVDLTVTSAETGYRTSVDNVYVP